MEELRTFHNNLIRNTPKNFFRFKFSLINWKQQMLAVSGPRGAGKTTLLLQYIKFYLDNAKTALYVTADHPYFYNHTLLDLAEDFVKNGGQYLCIDEVHKNPNWSRELKNVYDGFPELKVAFSASSALDIYRGESDLSRRVLTYDLPGLSFREYLAFVHQLHFDPISWNDLIHHHEQISMELTRHFHPLPYFREYLQKGYLPISPQENPEDYWVKLSNTINAVIDFDLAYIEKYNVESAVKVKKLLGVIAESVPFKPNIAALARKLDISRDSVYSYLNDLKSARLLNFLTAEGKGMGKMQKPDKLLLENPNLAYAFTAQPDQGALRESFLVNQLINAGIEIYHPKYGDVKADDQYIEIGGKNKTYKQLKEAGNGVIAADNIEMGVDRKIPLWLFGFLY